MSLEVLSQTSVDKLRKLAQDDIDILGFEFEELCQNFNLSTIELKINFDSKV